MHLILRHGQLHHKYIFFNMSQILQLTCKSESELPNLSKQLIGFAEQTKVWTFYGQLGAGKTTLIKEIARQLNVKDNMSSPSFSIINEYAAIGDGTIYHIDLYRIKNQQEAIDIGIEDYLFSNQYCFIEWPEIIEELLPKAYLALEINIHDFIERTIKASRYE